MTADLLALTSGRSTVLITHRLAGLESVDEILMMAEGQVVERETHDGSPRRRSLLPALVGRNSNRVGGHGSRPQNERARDGTQAGRGQRRGDQA